jgi:hypothetical protein
MEGHEIIPCTSGVMWQHIVLGVFTGINMLLTTWLTRRAVNRDKKEANGEYRRQKTRR